jgi:hypothetical protein
LYVDEPKYAQDLHYAIHKLSSTARFAKAVSERSNQPELVYALANELENRHIDNVLSNMRRSGVMSALDEAPEITFGELRRSVIPELDVRLLREAGVDDAEAEITILIQCARKRLGNRDATPSAQVEKASEELHYAAKHLVQFPYEENVGQREKKKKKLFNGIGKILAGTVTAAGNLLLVTGTIIAPNPATAYAGIGSSAIAVTSIFQGLGDLRGE